MSGHLVHRFYIVGTSDRGTHHWATVSRSNKNLNLQTVKDMIQALTNQAQKFDKWVKFVNLDNIIYLGTMTDDEWLGTHEVIPTYSE